MNTDTHRDSMQGRTVLLVDDEKMVLEVGKAILQRLGHEVITAESGEDALNQFGQHQDSIGCIVLDLFMPGMDGKSAFRQFRALSSELPIIIASGLSIDQVLDQFGDMPPTSVIQKPYQIADLATKIEGIINVNSPSA